MKALILTVLLALSCSREATLTKDAMGLRLLDVNMNITHLKEIEWPVGKRKEVTLTQSMVFVVEMPKVDPDDLEYITEAKGINAWILRLIVDRGSEKQDLGSLYALFKPKKVIRGQSGGAPTNVSIKVFYAAAYASERFRSFECPALGHNRKITKMAVKGDSQKFELNLDQMTSYPEKSHLVELAPSSFNAGNSLLGEYYVEIAAYDSVKKVIYGGFKRLPVYVEVSGEEPTNVQSCAGERPEISL